MRLIATYTLSLTRRESFDTFVATTTATKRALSVAGCSIDDVDLIEVHDGFSIVEILTLEDLGLCGRGEGARFIAEGNADVDGPRPVNISGGLKAGGHPVGATGVRQLVTLAKALRGEVRMAKRPRRGLAQNVGGVGSIVSIHILEAGK